MYTKTSIVKMTKRQRILLVIIPNELLEDSFMFLEKPCFFNRKNSKVMYCRHIYISQWEFKQVRFIFYFSIEDIFLNEILYYGLYCCFMAAGLSRGLASSALMNNCSVFTSEVTVFVTLWTDISQWQSHNS